MKKCCERFQENDNDEVISKIICASNAAVQNGIN